MRDNKDYQDKRFVKTGFVSRIHGFISIQFYYLFLVPDAVVVDEVHIDDALHHAAAALVVVLHVAAAALELVIHIVAAALEVALCVVEVAVVAVGPAVAVVGFAVAVGLQDAENLQVQLHRRQALVRLKYKLEIFL